MARSTLDLFAKESRVPHLCLSPVTCTLPWPPSQKSLLWGAGSRARPGGQPPAGTAAPTLLPGDPSGEMKPFLCAWCFSKARDPELSCTSFSLHPSFLPQIPPEWLENSLEPRSRSHHHQCSVLLTCLLISQPHPPTPLRPHLPLLWGHQTSGCCPPPSLRTCCSLLHLSTCKCPGQPPSEPALRILMSTLISQLPPCVVSTAAYITAPWP